ncbi:HNH endonuclease [candidate division KSB1 bacterium RBG_16_48_16]|nr:MAG: HNH endonuclease [candidate division KSB1 bacterium RBG_16_48_16]
MLSARVLLLNQNYEPMTVVSAKKAIVLVYLEKVEIVVPRSHLVRSQRMAIPLPSIIRLIRYIQIPKKRVELTRRNILKRDGYRCQYCGTKEGPLTIDHVIPKTRNGTDSWENLVCACVKCNNKKGNRTPEGAGMKLLHKPKKPSYLFFIQHFIGVSEDCWKPYLFMN